MIIHPITGMPVFSHKKIREDADWLRKFLDGNNISITKDSFFHLALDEAARFPAELNRSAGHYQNLRPIVSGALGISYLSSLIRRVAKNPYFNRFLPMINDIAKTNPLMTQQATSDQYRNTIFELEIACLFLAIGREVVRTEPDLRVLHDGAIDIACKMVYSANPVTVADRIEEGISQILSYDGTSGLVFLGLTNRASHDVYLPLLDEEGDIWGSFVSEKAMKSVILRTLSSMEKDILQQATTRFSKGSLDGRFRGIAMIFHTVCGIDEAPALITATGFIERHRLFGLSPVILPERELLKILNDCAQKIAYS